MRGDVVTGMLGRHRLGRSSHLVVDATGLLAARPRTPVVITGPTMHVENEVMAGAPNRGGA